MLEYVGRHINASEGESLFKECSDTCKDKGVCTTYSLFSYNPFVKVMILYFQFLSFCSVDDTKETERLGRFINDDHIKPNSRIENSK